MQWWCAGSLTISWVCIKECVICAGADALRIWSIKNKRFFTSKALNFRILRVSYFLLAFCALIRAVKRIYSLEIDQKNDITYPITHFLVSLFALVFETFFKSIRLNFHRNQSSGLIERKTQLFLTYSYQWLIKFVLSCIFHHPYFRMFFSNQLQYLSCYWNGLNLQDILLD